MNAPATGGLVLIVEENLFFHAKLEGGLKLAGFTPRVAVSREKFAAALAESPRAILISLACKRIDWREWIAAARATLGDRFPILGYGAHVNEPLFEAGLAAGCSAVFPNGQISAQAGALVSRFIGT